MFEQVASWEAGLAAYVADLDPAVIDGWDAKKLVLHHVRMEKLDAAAKTVMLQRVAQTRTWAHRGDRSFAHWLAREAGIGLGEAMATVDTAARLPECPATETALRAGKLSRVQANEVTSAAVLDPDRLRIAIAGHLVFDGRAGGPQTFDRAAARDAMAAPEILIRLDLGLGDGRGEAFGCDLTEAYVRENSEYTT